MENLLSEIEAFRARHSMSASAFGDMAVRDRHLVFHLRKGREPRSSVVARIRQYMADQDAVAA